MTWIIIGWSALIGAGIIVWSLSTAAKSCGDIVDSAFAGDGTCTDIAVNGKAAVIVGHAVGLIIVWIVGFVVLAAIWFMTRKTARTCPHCGESLKTGVTTCPTCGYDFARASGPAQAAATAEVAPAAVVTAAVPVVALPKEGWYPDSERPGHNRWWDGNAWGMRDDEHPSAAIATGNGGTETAIAPAEEPTSAVEAVSPADGTAVTVVDSAARPAVASAVVVASSEPVVAAAPLAGSEPEAPAPARFCGNCGAERRPGANFCTSCGQA